MKKQSAFTLVELMVVLAIIAVLGTAGISAYTGYARKARDTSRVATSLHLESAVINYKGEHNNKAPTPAQLVAELDNKPILDPAGGSNVCLGVDGTPGQPCRFDYVKYDDGTYSISYGIESPANMQENFYQTQFEEEKEGNVTNTVKVGVYRGTADFIGKPTDTNNQYKPIYPTIGAQLTPLPNSIIRGSGRLDTVEIIATAVCPPSMHFDENDTCVCDPPLEWSESSEACILLGPPPTMTSPPIIPPPPAVVSFLVTISGDGTVTGNAGGYEYGATATITAVPQPGSMFQGWTGACTGTNLTCNVYIDGPKNATAIFTQYTLTTALAGNNNDIKWTAVNPNSDGTDITIAYADPSLQTTTTISVSGKDIIIIPGTNIAPIVLNTTSNFQFWSAMFGSYSQQYTDERYLYYGLDINGNNEWQKSTTKKVYFDTGYWYLTGFGLFDGQRIVLRAAGTASDNPALLTFAHGPTSQAWGGVWTITRAPDTSATASQVLAAIAASPAASALVTGSLAPGNDGSGSVTAMAQSGLSPN